MKNKEMNFEVHPVFSGLDSRCLSILRSSAEILSFKKDEYVFNQGDNCNGFYILFEGTAVITVKRDRRDVINRIVFKNDVFGLDSALQKINQSKGARAVGGPITVLRVPMDIIQVLMSYNAEFSLRLFNILISSLKKIEKRLESFVFQDAKDRIIDFIKINANNSGIQVGMETLIRHSFTQQNIADYTGTSRQTVTTIFKELSSNNKISFQRKRILVRNLAML